MSLAERIDGREVSAVHFHELRNADFAFIPRPLAEKCKQLIEACHAMSHYRCLPDMLWHSETRDFIELNKGLRQIFRKASICRSAKKANEGYALIATVILSLEVLVRDFAGWGRRFPGAKLKAERLISEFRPNPQGWLIDLYLYPRIRSATELISTTLAPTDEPKSQHMAGTLELLPDEYAADASVVLARRSPSPA